ncbi:MAG: PAS domain S-box protein [Bacteroidia bacterium]|nr:PAS domain S-box protein [Bacteroidia bacterium]
MELNSTLQKHVTQFLTADQVNDPSFKEFINEVNKSYAAFEGDQSHVNIAFKHSEKVFERTNETETELNTTLQLLTTLLSNIHSGILAEDENRKVIFTNQMFCDIFSIPLKPGQLIGMDCSNAAEQTKELFKKPVSYVSEINKLLHFKKPAVGQLLEMEDDRFFERNFMPIYINEEFKGCLWKYTDVTEKIATERELKKSEENYRNMIEHASDIIYKTDHMGLFIFANPVAERITGYKIDELYKMNFSDLIKKEYKLKAIKFYLNQIRKKISSTYFEFPIITKKGKEVWIGQSVQFSMLNVNSDEFELIALAIDITKQKKSESELKESNQKLTLLQNLIDNSSDSIQVATEDGELFYYNKEAKKRLGLSDENLSKFSVIDIEESFKNLEDWKAHIAELKEKNVLTIEGNNVNQSDGKMFPVEITARFVKINDIGYVIANARDITARKQIEKLLKKQEEKYRNIIANMNLGLIEVNLKEEILYVNQSFCNMSGYSAADLIGKNAKGLFAREENSNLIESKLKLRAKSISDMYQLLVKDKNGRPRWWSISGAPNYDDSGELIGSIGIHLDITDQKLLEKDLEAALLKAELGSKAKEAFLANMSHEIRTPLNAIIGMIRELSKEELSVTQKICVENSSIASKHLLSVINNVLDISKIEAGELTLESEHFMVDQSINNIMSIMSSRAEEKGIYLKSEFSPQIHKTLVGDPLRLEQILLNLVGNAVKFTNKGGITIKCEPLKETALEQTIRIEVSDTGVGMDEHYLKNIFKKFSQEDRSVSRKYGGTGLGLAITFELMQLMNGSIDVKSEKKVGTTFSLNITLKKGEAVQVKSSFKSNEKVDLDGLKILLVEDNEINRLVAQNTFKYYNCVVEEAVNGLDALEKLKQTTYDIILMDIQMPEMDGLQATQKIRHELNIKTPILALTANAFKSEIEKCKHAGMNDYITKPFEEIELIKLISKYTKKKTSDKEITEIAVAKENGKNLYDLGPLKEMSRGNSEFMNKMITLFIEQANISLNEINAAHGIKDYDTVCKVAHRLKSSIDSMGITSLKKEIRELEKLSKEPVLLSEIAALVMLINATLLKVLQCLPSEII